MSESPFYPYPPRPGTRNESVSITPDYAAQLEPHERDAVIEFERNLYELKLDAASFPSAEEYRAEKESAGVPLQPLETVWRKKVNSIEINADYFLTQKGKEQWKATTGNELSAESLKQAITELSAQDIHSISAERLDELEAESIGDIEAKLTKEFIDNNYRADGLSNPNIITLYKNPETLVEKMQGYRNLKTYMKYAKADLMADTADNSAVVEGKLLIIDLYRKRINTFLADGYITAQKILNQHQLSESAAHPDVIKNLEKVLPAFKNTDDSLRNAHLLQRLDRYKNGVSEDENGSYTWKSPEALDLMTQSISARTEDAQDVERGAYSDITSEALNATKITGETFGEFAKSILQEYDLLSEYDDWNSEREGPAADGKWQVIVNDKFKSLAVDDKQRIVKVSTKDVSLASALPLLNHEIFHVIQHTNKRALGSLAIMQSIGLDNVSEQTEAGGKWQEKVAREILTGKERNLVAGTGYFKALEVKEQGGTFGEVVQAYYDDLRVSSSLSPELAAAQAVNRARRIFRAGGFEYAQNNTFVTNTQPLSYLEQRLIYESLDDSQRKVLAVGGVTIRNLVRLSEAGLIDAQNISIPEKTPIDLLHDTVKELTAPSPEKKDS